MRPKIGFDLIGTTMAGYTEYTKGCSLPPYRMIKTLVEQCGKPVIAEGNISTPEQCRHAMDIGVHAVVVGSAITGGETTRNHKEVQGGP